MAFSTMHFGVGMACAGVAATGVCLVVRRGWRFIPAAMTLGGIWAMVPDLPRFFREDFPNLPLAGLLGAKGLEKWLHSHGNLFAFHQSLDMQPKEFTLLGMAMILLGYNMAIAQLMWLEHRQRNSIGNRSWAAHKSYLRQRRRTVRQEARTEEAVEEHVSPTNYDGDAVIHRIGPQEMDETG